MKKKITAIIILAAMLLCIACGAGQKSEVDECYEGIDISGKPVTITYLTIGDKPTNGMTEKVIDELNKILLKKANAKLDIYYVAWDDYLNNYNSALSMDGESLDIVGTGSDWLDSWPNVLNGNFMPLDRETLKTYCPQTYAHVSDKDWSYCTYNDKIYMIPENEYTQWTNHGFIYREDIANEAGIDEIRNWGDLDTYFRYIRTTRPRMVPWDSDGKKSIHALGYLMSVKQYVPIYELGTYGVWGAYSNNPGRIVSPYYEGETFISFAKLMKEWDKIGVWREDLNYAGKNEEEFYMGEAAVVQHHTQNFYTIIKPNMEIVKPEARTKFFFFGQENGNLVRTSILHGAVGISSKSKHPQRALMVYDILRNDEECYRLLNYGIEGVQYVINDEGMLAKPSGYNAEKDGIVTNFWWGRRDEYEIKDSSFAWDDYEALLKNYDYIAKDYPWDGVSFARPEINDKIQGITKVCDKYVPLIAYGQYDVTPEEEVRLFREELKAAGIEEVTEELQKILNSN